MVIFSQGVPHIASYQARGINEKNVCDNYMYNMYVENGQ